MTWNTTDTETSSLSLPSLTSLDSRSRKAMSIDHASEFGSYLDDAYMFQEACRLTPAILGVDNVIVGSRMPDPVG
jgi:hypothetical protein